MTENRLPAATSTVKFHPVRSMCGGLKFPDGEDIFVGFQPPFPHRKKERESEGGKVGQLPLLLFPF